jgi:hypothetical protein
MLFLCNVVARKKFHRDPGPNDPIFFDLEADSPQPLSEAKVAAMFTEMIDAAKEADISPAYIYAMRKTGRIVTDVDNCDCTAY